MSHTDCFPRSAPGSLASRADRHPRVTDLSGKLTWLAGPRFGSGPLFTDFRPPHAVIIFGVVVVMLLWGSRISWGADDPPPSEPTSQTVPTHSGETEFDRCERLAKTGHYAECIRRTAREIDGGKTDPEWAVLKAEAELSTGRIADARETVERGLRKHSGNLQLLFLAQRTARMTGRTKQAEARLDRIAHLAETVPWRYTTAEDLVTIGRAALEAGANRTEVLEGFFEPAHRRFPEAITPKLAIGELSLERQDYERAGNMFAEVLRIDPDHADAHLGLACALRGTDPPAANESLNRCLRINPNHLSALLLRAEGELEAERYAAAEKILDRIETIHPGYPPAWAFRSALAHLQNDLQAERTAREKAFARWDHNPEIDFLIGEKLSRKYRFREGAAHQRKALAMDPTYAPARLQLVQDLLRLGNEKEGWTLAEAIHRDNADDITAHNLVKLKKRLAEFTTLEDEHFIIRMGRTEAKVYGDRVTRLLHRARETLCEKYRLDLDEPIIVEIFPNADDFAVRSFGVPEGGNYLGVCFGRVITANSPASEIQAANPTNWESVLWHEFTHTVTLTLTANRMPRWFSEGISVYEERQANPTWGQGMNARYREFILNGDLTPIRELTAAFHEPKSPAHVDFAYFQSSLVIEFLVDRYGHETLLAILRDLKVGMPLNTALDRHTDGLPLLERDFAAHARKLAENFAAEADWTRYDFEDILGEKSDRSLTDWLRDHPRSIFGLHARVGELMNARDYRAAIGPLETLVELNPTDILPDNATLLLAEVHARLGNETAERELLEEYTTHDPSAFAVDLRLIELYRRSRNYRGVKAAAERVLAVNPMLPPAWIALAHASERMEDPQTAMHAHRTLLVLRPEDAPQWHYHLGRLLKRSDPEAARRHVRLSLETAPRNRSANALLDELGPRRE